MDFSSFLKDRVTQYKPVYFDGAMGSMLQSSGTSYRIPEEVNITCPGVVEGIHTAYLNAGSNVISANTFGLNSEKHIYSGSSYDWQRLLASGVDIARRAIDATSRKDAFVAWDTGQIGRLLVPMGDLSFDSAYNAYKAAAILAESSGADIALVETQADLYEVKAAILAIKENTRLPVIASMTFNHNLVTLTGANVLTVVTVLEALKPLAIGFNCGGGLDEDRLLLKDFLRYASIPLIVQPNAGIPNIVGGRAVYDLKEKDYADFMVDCAKGGVTILGGCCGTTPEYIAAMVKATSDVDIGTHTRGDTTGYVSSGNTTVAIGGRPCVVGERINPTGKKKCKAALVAKDMQYIVGEARRQIEAGADVLDINTGLPGVDERELMTMSIKAVQGAFPRVPLQIDSSDSGVLEAALRYYNGKPLVNSVNGKKEVMDKVLPIVAKYGGVVVALCIDENGISPTVDGRVAVADKIIAECAKYNIPMRDIVVDTLTLTVSSNQEQVVETVRAISSLKAKYGKEGLHFILGVSNVSFGLPHREVLNSRFLSIALYSGLDACIINPLSMDMMGSIYAHNALLGYDNSCLEYIREYANLPVVKPVEAVTTVTSSAKAVSVDTPSGGSQTDEAALIAAIVGGDNSGAPILVKRLLETVSTVHIIDTCIVPALDIVGRDYEKGVKFLPELLLSATAAGASFDVIKERLAATSTRGEFKGKIILATVEGDIHDIGKNIVRAMLENYGYTVIDLGKNVSVSVILEAIKREDVHLVGLSALMTTTVSSMERTIAMIKQEVGEGSCSVMVGGAVLTSDYAKRIGATYYAKDAMASVRIAREFFGK